MWFLALGLLAIALYPLLGERALNVVYEAIVLASVGVVAVRVPARTTTRPTWAWFALGLALEMVGDTIEFVDAYHRTTVGPLTLSADLFYVLGYVALTVGGIRLLMQLGVAATRVTLLESGAFFFALLTVQWLVVTAANRVSDVSWITNVVDVSYPSMDIVLLVVVFELASNATTRSGTGQLLVASMLPLVAADEIDFLNASSYAVGGIADCLWLGSYVLWGAAALRPELPIPRRRPEPPSLSDSRSALLLLAALAIPATVFVRQVIGRQVEMYVACAGSAVVTLLVVLRMREAVRSALAQNAMLRELDQLKDDFVASVSHEFRTPLTAIDSYIELLDDDKERLDPEHREYVSIIKSSSARLVRLVSDLLLVAALQARPADARRDVEIGRAHV